ncbi:UNVERIFIED_CONTAM: hypothetical protein GTU68_018894 [Idotea baltica]|nr:hypothetical protein [Idotea baltica]
MTRIACIGEAMVELSMVADQPAVGVAGDTLNTAVYLKRTAPDFTVSYLTKLGMDPFSKQILSFIQSQNIDTDAIETSPTQIPGLYAITTNESGERFFTYWRSQSAARDLFQDAGEIDFSGLASFDILYLSGITLAILPENVRQTLLEYLKGSSQKLAFDSNYRPKLWEDQATAQRWVRAFWEIADYALPSIDDEMELFDECADDVRARFKRAGIEGALKQGAEGPFSLGDTDVVQNYSAASHVIDTTAAGDSFNGAYLAARLSGQSQAASLMAGHLCAAHVVQHRGAIVPPQTGGSAP